jgi:hypothetical protein
LPKPVAFDKRRATGTEAFEMASMSRKYMPVQPEVMLLAPEIMGLAVVAS